MKIDGCLDTSVESCMFLKVRSLLPRVICVHKLMIVSFGVHFVLPHEVGDDGI